MRFKFIKSYLNVKGTRYYPTGTICVIINAVVYSKDGDMIFDVDSNLAREFGVVCEKEDEPEYNFSEFTRDYIKTRIKNYEIALDKILDSISECCNNDLWDVVKCLEDGKNKLLNLIQEDKKLLNGGK